MSKRIESNATVGHLQAIGDIMHKNKPKNLRANISEWLDANPEIYDDLWEMIDTGLIWNIQAGQERASPRSCTSWGKLGAYVKMAMLKRGVAELDKNSFKALKQVDGKVLDRLLMAKYGIPKTMPMFGGMPI